MKHIYLLTILVIAFSFRSFSQCSVYAGKDTAVCQYGSYQFNVVSSGTGFPAYSWTPSEFLSDSTISNPSCVVVDISRNYIVTVTYPGGCTASDTIKVMSICPIPDGDAFHPGGNDFLITEILDHVIFSDSAIIHSVSGTVKLSYYVDPDSTLSDITILQDIGYGCGDSVISILVNICRTDPYMPAVRSNVRVRQQVFLDIPLNASGDLICHATVFQGKVTTSDNQDLANSKIHIYRYTDSLSLAAVGFTDGNGNYSLTLDSSVYNSGDYFYLLADPDSVVYPNELPTYYSNAVSIQGASTITEICNSTKVVNFLTTHFADSIGGGSISGTINTPPGGLRKASFRTSGGTPASGVKILLMNEQDQPAGSTYTNSGGNFIFNNLASGSYRLFIDNLSVDNSQAPVIAINNAGSVNGQFILHSTNLEKTSLVTAAGNNMIGSNYVNVYPNPASSIMNINIGNTNFSYALVNMSGELVASGKRNDVINVAGFNKGLYLLKLQSEGDVVYRKVIIE